MRHAVDHFKTRLPRHFNRYKLALQVYIVLYLYIYIIDIIRIYMYTVCVSCIRIILISFRKMIMVTGNHLQAEEEGNSVG